MTIAMTPLELRAWRLKTITERDGYFCFHPDCRKPFTEDSEITFDHWIPQSRGGTWDIENLRIMHKRCNAWKSDDVPNEDGTLPPKKRAANSAERRSLRQSVKVEVCKVCNAGRLIEPGDNCVSCGSGPMPLTYPGWAKMSPKDCSHEYPFWCWMEALEPGLRKPAIVDVLDGEYSLD